MLLNRLQALVRELRPEHTHLRHRARAARRRPLIFVPGFLGSRLVDRRGRVVWGSLASLYVGPPIASAEGLSPAGLFNEVRTVPGLYHYDIHAGLLSFLARAGGYRLGEDLFPLAYDWRTGVLEGVSALAALVERVRGAADEPVDLVGLSTGGQIVRTFLASGGGGVRRAVYVAAPQRGSFDALASLVEGFRPAPGGRRFDGREVGLCQTAFDAMPHPAERLFVDPSGRALDIDHYDPIAWRRLGLDPGIPDLALRLAHARRLHEALDRAATSAREADAIVIGGKHLPTRARILVTNGRPRIPTAQPARDEPFKDLLYLPGDGELPLASLGALPGLTSDRLWFVRPEAHCRLPADPDVHRQIVEALLV